MAGNVTISHQALQQVFTDSVEAGGIEVGGLLVGYPTNRRIHIRRVIPTSRGTITRIPITSEDIARATQKLNRDEQIVGWYHSHPGHSVFFSQDDIDSHERFLEFNPRFQALVIDPVQARQGDSIVDCVKFYAVKNHRAIEIDDYRVTDSSGERLYDPRAYVFDEHGSPYHRPLAHVGITAADDRQLRHALGTIMTERDELQDGYIRLRKHWKSTYHFSRKTFPFMLIILILITGISSFLIGRGFSQVHEEENGVDISLIEVDDNPVLDRNERTFTIRVKIHNYDTTMKIESFRIFSGRNEILSFEGDEIPTLGTDGSVMLVKRDLKQEEMDQLGDNRKYVMKMAIMIGDESAEFVFDVKVIKEDVPKRTISISEASFDWESRELKMKADFLGFEQIEYKILICLLDNKNIEIKRLDTDLEISEDANPHRIVLSLKGTDTHYLKDCKKVRIEISVSNEPNIISNEIDLTHIFVKIKGDKLLISNGELTFQVFVYELPKNHSYPSFDVFLDPSDDPTMPLATFDGAVGKVPSGSIVEEFTDAEFGDNVITITLKFRENYEDLVRGKRLYVVVYMGGKPLTTPPVEISLL